MRSGRPCSRLCAPPCKAKTPTCGNPCRRQSCASIFSRQAARACASDLPTPLARPRARSPAFAQAEGKLVDAARLAALFRSLDSDADGELSAADLSALLLARTAAGVAGASAASPLDEMLPSNNTPVEVHLSLTGQASQMRVMWVSATNYSSAPQVRFGQSPGNMSSTALGECESAPSPRAPPSHTRALARRLELDLQRGPVWLSRHDLFRGAGGARAFHCLSLLVRRRRRLEPDALLYIAAASARARKPLVRHHRRHGRCAAWLDSAEALACAEAVRSLTRLRR